MAIPHSDFTDNRVLRSSPRDFYNVYKDTFDYLYRAEKPAMINLTVHAHFGGRPMMSAMLSELLGYMKSFPKCGLPATMKLRAGRSPGMQFQRFEC